VPTMAMFPLGLVVLPGAVVPLHVFEPRYRALVRSLLAIDGPMRFGIPPIMRGSEVGGGDVRGDVATVVDILDLRVHDDGRYDMVVAGTARVEIRSWLPEDPFPHAEVAPFPDVDGDRVPSDSDVGSRLERIERMLGRMRRLGDPVPESVPALDVDPVVRVFQLGVVAPVGDLDRLGMLVARSAHERLRVLDRALDDVEAVLDFRES
jgi:Lon protease-like protein